MVPDYWIKVDRMLSEEDTTVRLDEAGGTYVTAGGVLEKENKWRTPAAWVVKVRGGKA